MCIPDASPDSPGSTSRRRAPRQCDTLLAAVEEHRPDVVLTDIRMPPSQSDEGIRAADVIRSAHPEIGVVVLSQYFEPEYARRLFEHGSDGRAHPLKERVAGLDGSEVRFVEWPTVDRSSTRKWSKR